MSAKELAALLNGRTYGAEITDDEEAQAKAAGLVVVFGYSDDNMEFRGAVHEEIGCYGGGTAYFTINGLFQSECDDDNCPYANRLAFKAQTIEAKWNTYDYSWVYETAIPHEPFEILEDGEKYCRGIVFALSDVTERKETA